MALDVAERLEDEIDGDEEDFEDETLAERLWGLTEMFPESFRNATSIAADWTLAGVKRSYTFTRSALWISSTSFMILVLPVLFETEMAQMEQAQIQKQRQILLGPNAAMSGSSAAGVTPPLPGPAVAAPAPSR